MCLFKAGNFIGHSGRVLPWKIECDALTEEDWAGLAAIATERFALGDFTSIIGVPRGGLPFANALARALPRPNRAGYRVLVVDDVLTTGGSILEYMEAHPSQLTHGLVAFARGPLPPRVSAIWALGS